jgi:hypothetical protein
MTRHALAMAVTMRAGNERGAVGSVAMRTTTAFAENTTKRSASPEVSLRDAMKPEALGAVDSLGALPAGGRRSGETKQ